MTINDKKRKWVPRRTRLFGNPEVIRPNIFCLFIVFIIFSFPAAAVGATTLYQSVELALITNPQLKALAYNSQAAQYDLRRARGGYLPTIDLLLGYGLEQHSDEVTRQNDSDPGDTDWDPLGRAALSLNQMVYDGGKTSSQVSIQKALLNSANYQIQAAAQTIALEAVAAHLSVFWKRELVSLAEKNLKIHRDIYQPMLEREQAGVGSIADVSQAQARMARAESTFYRTQADQSEAVANYTRVIGTPPGELTDAGAPETLPQTLEEALERTEKDNPELLSLAADMDAADSRLALARSNYKPEIDIGLNSRYSDQQEGDPYWQYTNDAMVLLRWNLYDGGRDKAGISAALSRKGQSGSRRDARQIELTEQTATAWANYLSLQRQKTANRDALEFSRKTFDAYLVQFSISQRNLLEVLIVENDYFFSALQLATVGMREPIAAYRILALMGALQVPPDPSVGEYSGDYKRLKQALVLPSLTQLISSPPDFPPSGQAIDPDPDEYSGQYSEVESQASADATPAASGEGSFPRSGLTLPGLSNIRTAPDGASAVKMRVEGATPLRITGMEGPWLELRLQDESTGWIHHALVEKDTAP